METLKGYYTKYNNEWCVKITGETTPKIGDKVIVTKKNGERKTETVEDILLIKDNARIVSIEKIQIGGYCEECGSRINQVDQHCWETGGLCYRLS